jgi:cytochrome b561
MTRYHPVLVVLHWLMALMILMALVAGSLLLDPMPNDSPDKAGGLAGHMTVGLLIGALLILRIISRFTTAKPPKATTGNMLLDRIGVWTHWAFYILVTGMVLSGIATAIGADLFSIAFGTSETVITNLIDELPQRVAHGLFATLLMILIVLHIIAAIYHQFILKDGLFRRMWFGKRVS